MLSIILAIYFEYAVDIWYLFGSLVVPALLIPLIAGLYRIKVKYATVVMIVPLSISIFWYFYGLAHLSGDGYPVYIWELDPMYPGLLMSGILFTVFKRSQE